MNRAVLSVEVLEEIERRVGSVEPWKVTELPARKGAPPDEDRAYEIHDPAGILLLSGHITAEEADFLQHACEDMCLLIHEIRSLRQFLTSGDAA